MEKTILIALIPLICAAGLPENSRFTQYGTRIPERYDLSVRWKARNTLPKTIWVYRLLPNRFSPAIISNLMTVCSFTEKDKVKTDTNAIAFQTKDGARSLIIYFPYGFVQYQPLSHYGPTNLAKGVPDEKQAVKEMTAILPRLGIRLSDVDKKENSSKPAFLNVVPETVYFVNHTFITNVEYRGFIVVRQVDGIRVFGFGRGGDCEIDFGEYSKVVKIELSWRNLERYKRYATYSPEILVKLLRAGRAVQGPLTMNIAPIDWSSVRSVTITKVLPGYYVGGTRSNPSDWLLPFVALTATVDTGHGNIDVEIDCPVIDDSR